ncbi:MAG: T9SS type A sorting domain-containing protein [Flavobacteriales bacterium]
MQRSLAAGLFLALGTWCAAQVQYGGRAHGLGAHAEQLPEAPVATLPPLDVETLLQEDAVRLSTGVPAPYRFAATLQTDLGLQQGVWATAPNGDRVWRLSVECRNAHSMGLVFDRFVLAPEGRVFVYNAAGEQRGSFKRPANGRTRLAVDQHPGERLTIEYVEPSGSPAVVDLHISTVYPAYRREGMARDFGESLACNINVICPEGDDWRDQIRSVALVNTGSGYCSGTLLNNCLNDGTPYFLTANHCLVSPVEDWIFIFNWDSPTCSPTENASQEMSIAGADQLATDVATDFTFLRLNEVPPEAYDVYYSGWDASGVPAQEVVSIHHPSGDIKKISRSFDPVEADVQVVGTEERQVWQIEDWTEGIVEEGSSGSGLWNENKLLVGQLSGGLGDCETEVAAAAYGRFDLAFPLMEPWLGDCGTTVDGVDSDDVVVPIFKDAAVTSITNIPELLCDVDSIAPRITLKNNGLDDLTSAVIEYSINGGPVYTQAWSGSLVTGQTANVALAAIPAVSGANALVIASTLPNNTVDQVPENDAWIYDFTASFPAAAINLILTLDAYGSDVTWDLATEAGTTLYSGGPYEDDEEGELDSVAFCLTNGCYTFTILDEFGNGLCCDDGEGNYVIRDVFGAVYGESDGQYTTENISEFCLEAVSVPEITPMAFAIHPNPNDGAFSVVIEQGIQQGRLRVLDALGRSVHESSTHGATIHRVDLRVPAGAYFVVVEGATGSRTQRMIITR